MSKSECEPNGENQDYPEFEVRYFDPHDATDHDLRRIVAEALFSPKSQTVILFRYPNYEDAISPIQFNQVSSESLFEVTQFINEKAMELGFSEQVTVITYGPFPTLIISIIE